MFKNKVLKRKKILIVTTIIFLFLFLVLSVELLPKKESEILLRLRSMGFKDVETRDVTFNGYESQKISATNDVKIFLQIVKNVELNSSQQLLEKFEKKAVESKRNFTIIDSYSGEVSETDVPEELKAVKEMTKINNKSVSYYIVYANEIFSLKLISEKEVKFKGLISTYYCEKEMTIYNLEVYSKPEKFDKRKSLDILSSLFCR